MKLLTLYNILLRKVIVAVLSIVMSIPLRAMDSESPSSGSDSDQRRTSAAAFSAADAHKVVESGSVKGKAAIFNRTSSENPADTIKRNYQLEKDRLKEEAAAAQLQKEQAEKEAAEERRRATEARLQAADAQARTQQLLEAHFVFQSTAKASMEAALANMQSNKERWQQLTTSVNALRAEFSTLDGIFNVGEYTKEKWARHAELKGLILEGDKEIAAAALILKQSEKEYEDSQKLSEAVERLKDLIIVPSASVMVAFASASG